MFDNKMLKRIYVFRELNNGRMEIFTKWGASYFVPFSPDIVRIIKAVRMKLAGNVACKESNCTKYSYDTFYWNSWTPWAHFAWNSNSICVSGSVRES
jgi:hypothetical protein